MLNALRAHCCVQFLGWVAEVLGIGAEFEDGDVLGTEPLRKLGRRPWIVGNTPDVEPLAGVEDVELGDTEVDPVPQV